MRDKHIANLESRLESMIEGAFASVFGRRIRAQDVALHLARSMENNLHPATTDDARPVAPDIYKITLSEKNTRHLLQHQPNLTTVLSTYMLDLATQSGYRLENEPIITVHTDPSIASDNINVRAQHSRENVHSTSILQRVDISTREQAPKKPQIVIGSRILPLEKVLINIGRSLENDIVLDDQHASRHHAQLRLRFGRYTLFDVQSRAGTFVNDRRIQQHNLTSGDVIRMGETRLVYLEEREDDQSTAKMPPVESDGDR
ncbi:MAG: FhaA domain-containing protein [Chloroflexota bacterium]